MKRAEQSRAEEKNLFAVTHTCAGLRNSRVSQDHSVYVCVCVSKAVLLNDIYNKIPMAKAKRYQLAGPD